jgi:RNA polymerase sigma-70 factor, ECF subfamily
MTTPNQDQNTQEIQIEKDLVNDLLNGVNDAWDELYQLYHEKIVRYCSNYVKSLDEAEDLAHEVFIKLKDKASLFNPENKFRPWLYCIARNHCLDYLRKQKLRKPKGELWSKCYFASTTRIEIPDFRSGPATEALKLDDSNEIYCALDELTEEHRSVFLLKYVEDFTRQEISETLDIPLATVKSRLYYSLKNLREKLTLQ